MAHCCLCGGDLMLLGQLGRTKQFRCRHCGMIFLAVSRARSDEAQDQAKQPQSEENSKENQSAAS